MGRSDLRGKAQFRRYWEIRFFTTLQCWQFFLNEGQLRPPIARPKHLLPQFGTHILNRLDMRIHQEASRTYHTIYLYKKIELIAIECSFFWHFLVISQFVSKIYIVKSAIFFSVSFDFFCMKSHC